MKIDYKKFNNYSEKSQLRMVTFARLLLSLIEIYSDEKIPISDFERESFTFEESSSLVKKFNEILGDIIVVFYLDVHWIGPMSTRFEVKHVDLKSKPDAPSRIKSFLSKVSKKQEITSKSLKDSSVEFDDSLAQIIIDGTSIQLPAYGKEHFFARACFNRRKGESVDWTIIYNEMQDKKETDIPDKKNWRYVYDACNDINKRIQELLRTKQKLFLFSEKTVKRLH